MQPLVIQAHLNEGTTRARCLHVPINAQEVGADAIAAARAGAAIIHFHGRDAGGAQVPDDVEYYRTAARILHSESEALWYPPQGFASRPETRWRHLPPLVEDDAARLRLITIDPFAFDMMIYDSKTKQIRQFDLARELGSSEGVGAAGTAEASPMAPLDQWMWFCREAERLRLKPIFGALEPGAIRRVLAWHDMGLVSSPVIFHFMLSESMAFGLPPSPKAIEVYLDMIPDSVPVEWFMSATGCSAAKEQELSDFAITAGGHVRVGLGQPPTDGWGDREFTNAELVAMTVERADDLGRTPATPAEVEALFRVPA